ncbi:DnaA ATPase domain-containing protein [Parvularcula sp. LCG005]|uniref:DnaA ATPase domain-containing protein n=1 Tax=Parvularcula sp. LCG005 TaxID=3078805 RepID=UPI00294239E4|nr:DnaA/Hda family protein [Parvularcula sp. LCG005]WOI53918.1 DnaA/Hda family protein [Parvularcula sp. LCG005]
MAPLNASTDHADHFSAFKSGLRDHLGADVYASYFDHLQLGAWQGGTVVLLAKNAFAANVISERFSDPVRYVWHKTCGPVTAIEVTGSPNSIPNILRPADVSRQADGEKVQEAPMKTSALRSTDRLTTKNFGDLPAVPDRAATSAADPNLRRVLNDGALNSAQTLDRFCVNDTNRLARHAITRLLDGAGSPITYIFGASGRGKSHLLNAASVEWLRRYPTARLMYLHYDSLVADVSDACVSNGVKDLKEYLQDTDILVFDDVHLLRGRKRTQEELACLIDRLHQVGKPVLIAGAMSPAELAETGISQRLSDRLQGGLCVSVDRPDYELRLRVAQQVASQFEDRTGRTFPQRHVELIARRCETSIRELEGVMRLFTLRLDPPDGTDVVLTDDQVREILSQCLADRPQETSLDELFRYVIEVFEVSAKDMTSKSRKQALVRARQAFCLVARKLTDSALAAIGSMIQRDHTTVMHSIDKAEIIAETDAIFADKITRIFDRFDQSARK